MSLFRRKTQAPQRSERVVYSADEVVRGYHQRSKHGFQRYARGPYDLDWATQPDPFRRWIGTQLIELERDGPGEGTGEGPRWSEAIAGRVQAQELEISTVSRLLFDSLALSAWKEVGESRWSLRVNPSSGNLHPTEAHLLLPALAELGDHAGVYHYAPREHGLERRAHLAAENWKRLASTEGIDEFFVGLTSIHWREAWKYGERAFRYCQHDVGHALAALSISAAGLGWRATLVDELGSDQLAAWLGTSRTTHPEHETPDVLVRVRCAAELPEKTAPSPGSPDAIEWMGAPSDLSPDHVEWEAIEAVSSACHKPDVTTEYAPHERHAEAVDGECPPGDLRQIVRQRRSAVAMDAKTGMPSEGFFQMMDACLPRADAGPFATLPWQPCIHLAIFVQRVEGLAPGLYWLSREPNALERAQLAMREQFVWSKPPGAPQDLPLYLLQEGNVRGLAARLSCGQEIAADGAFSLGMIADFGVSLERHGAWFYPRLFWESGAIGQRLYLEAELHGLRGTGIGCFFDDPVHSTLGLQDGAWQSLYHFTIGAPVDDPRLRSAPAYPERS